MFDISSRRGSQRGGQSYRGHSHGSYEYIRGSQDNVQQRFRSQEWRFTSCRVQ